MDNNQKPNLELAETRLNYEATAVPEAKGFPTAAQTPEKLPTSQEMPSSGSPPASPVSTDPLASNPVSGPASATPTTALPQPTIPATPPLPVDETSEADFSESVLKAKQIIERNKDNPYVQNQEINEFKARVMKEKFNKDISTPKTA